MATKTLTITEDAYERLAAVKEDTESFSEVIVKHFPKHSLSELIGIWPHEDVAKLRAYIKERRRVSQERMDRIVRRLS